MALTNPSTLYSGGQGVFDPYKSVNLQLQLEARKKAKEEALDKYFRDLPNNLNPAGVQTKDLPDFDKKMDDIGQFWKANKQEIINPHNSIAQTQYQSLINDAKRLIQTSKNGADKLKIAADVLKDPKKSARVPNVVLEKIALAQLPVTHPDYRELEEDDLVFKAEPFDWAKQSKAFSAVKPNDEGVEIVTDPKTLTKTVITKSAFDDDAKNNIYNIAFSKYHSDPSVETFVEEELSKPQNYANLNSTFKKVYGKDIDNNKPEELYAAYVMNALQNERQKMKVTDDANAKIDKNFANAKTMEGIKQANRIQLAGIYSQIRRADSQSKEEQAYSNLEEYRLNQIKNGTKLPSIFKTFGVDTDNTVKLNLSPTDLENFDVEIPVVDEDGKQKTDGNGKPLLTKSKAKDVFYNTKTEEYIPIVDGVIGNKFKKDGWLISYINGAANTAPKIKMLAGVGINSGQSKESKKTVVSGSQTTRPNLPSSSSSSQSNKWSKYKRN